MQVGALIVLLFVAAALERPAAAELPSELCTVSLWTRASAPYESVSLDDFAAAVGARAPGAAGATAAWASPPDARGRAEVHLRLPSDAFLMSASDSAIDCRVRLASLAAEMISGQSSVAGGGLRLDNAASISAWLGVKSSSPHSGAGGAPSATALAAAASPDGARAAARQTLVSTNDCSDDIVTCRNGQIISVSVTVVARFLWSCIVQLLRQWMLHSASLIGGAIELLLVAVFAAGGLLVGLIPVIVQVSVC